MEEKKAEIYAFQEINLIFLDKSTSNGRDLSALAVKEEKSQTLQSLVIVRGQLNELIRSKVIPAPYDPHKS